MDVLNINIDKYLTLMRWHHTQCHAGMRILMLLMNSHYMYMQNDDCIQYRKNSSAAEEYLNTLLQKTILSLHHMGLVATKPVFWVSDIASYKSVSSATETC